MKNMIKVTNELPEEFILNLLSEAVREHCLLKTKATESRLLEACSTHLLKYSIKTQGLNTVLKETTQISDLHNQFKNQAQ